MVVGLTEARRAVVGKTSKIEGPSEGCNAGCAYAGGRGSREGVCEIVGLKSEVSKVR